MDTFDVPDWEIVDFDCGFFVCALCGVTKEHTQFKAIATDDYGEDTAERMTRRFDVVGPGPCNCASLYATDSSTVNEVVVSPHKKPSLAARILAVLIIVLFGLAALTVAALYFGW